MASGNSTTVEAGLKAPLLLPTAVEGGGRCPKAFSNGHTAVFRELVRQAVQNATRVGNTATSSTSPVQVHHHELGGGCNRMCVTVQRGGVIEPLAP